MTFNRRIDLRDDAKRREQAERSMGYTAGYAGRALPLGASQAFHVAWRHGRQARLRDGAA